MGPDGTAPQPVVRARLIAMEELCTGRDGLLDMPPF